MTDGFGVSEAVSIASVVIIVILTVVIYIWRKQDKSEADVGKVRTELAVLQKTVETCEKGIREIKKSLQKLEEEGKSTLDKLREVEGVAKEARKFSHDHAVFGKQV